MAFSQDLLNRLTIALAEPAAAAELDAAVSAATGEVSDVAYGVSWNGVTSVAPSKNAVYDKVDAMDTTIAAKLTATQAANVAALGGSLTGVVTGSMADVSAIALSTGDTYTDAAVNAAVNAAVTEMNLQLKELQTKLNAEIAALKLTNIQASA